MLVSVNIRVLKTKDPFICMSLQTASLRNGRGDLGSASFCCRNLVSNLLIEDDLLYEVSNKVLTKVFKTRTEEKLKKTDKIIR
jgi:hypothetical protein